MTGPPAAPEPPPLARTTGAVYLAYFLTAAISAWLLRGLVVPGDATATATRLLAHERQFRMGLAVDLLGNVWYLALTVLLYRLLAPVNRTISLLGAFFSLAGCAVQLSAGVFLRAALVALRSTPQPSGLGTEQLQQIALLFVSVHGQAVSVALVLFACYCLVLGGLVIRSRFLPPALGVLLAAAGLGWLTYLSPPLANQVARYVQPLGGIAEVAFMLWLLVRGVNVKQWHALAAARPTAKTAPYD
jgi:hypothetical protein